MFKLPHVGHQIRQAPVAHADWSCLTSCYAPCRNVVTLKNVSTPKCSTAAEAMEILKQVLAAGAVWHLFQMAQAAPCIVDV